MYEQFRRKVDAPALEPIVKRANTIENDADLQADLAGLEEYCRRGGNRKKKRTALAPGTRKTWMANVRSVYRFMGGYIEYSDEYVRNLDAVLEDAVTGENHAIKRITQNTRIAYLTALQELYRANWKSDYFIVKPETAGVDMTDPSKFHTMEEIKAIMDHVKTDTVFGIRDLAIISYAYYSASRNNEIGHVRLNDYNPETGVVQIKPHDGWTTKSNNPRVVNLPPQCCKHVNRWLEVRREHGIAPDACELFVTANASPFDSFSLNSVIKKHSAHIGLDTYPHKLRHSRCSHLLNILNWPPTVVQLFMGHARIETTMRYCHSTGKEQRMWMQRTSKDDIQ